MAEAWTLADLAPDQLALIDDTERTLDTDIVLAFRPTTWGTVDADTLAADGLHPVELKPDQLECLQGVEQRLGSVLVAYRRDPN
jgi:hypothetical protein